MFFGISSDDNICNVFNLSGISSDIGLIAFRKMFSNSVLSHRFSDKMLACNISSCFACVKSKIYPHSRHSSLANFLCVRPLPSDNAYIEFPATNL